MAETRVEIRVPEREYPQNKEGKDCDCMNREYLLKYKKGVLHWCKQPGVAAAGSRGAPLARRRSSRRRFLKSRPRRQACWGESGRVARQGRISETLAARSSGTCFAMTEAAADCRRGGPAGCAAASKAAQAGLEVTLYERGDLGGVCLHAGCIPAKASLQAQP